MKKKHTLRLPHVGEGENAKLIYAQWNVKGLMTTLYNYLARNWAKLAGWWGKLT